MFNFLALGFEGYQYVLRSGGSRSYPDRLICPKGPSPRSILPTLACCLALWRTLVITPLVVPAQILLCQTLTCFFLLSFNNSLQVLSEIHLPFASATSGNIVSRALDAVSADEEDPQFYKRGLPVVSFRCGMLTSGFSFSLPNLYLLVAVGSPTSSRPIILT